MKDRIKMVRKDLGLTMEKFGEPLGMKKNSISQIESGVNSPSNQTVSLICAIYGVNKEWLLTGEGSPYIERTPEQEVTEFLVRAQEGEITDSRMDLIKLMSILPEEDWLELERIGKEALAIIKKRMK